MRYSVGLLDSLFGKKIILQGPNEKGTIVKLKVSEKWLKQAQGECLVSSSQEDTGSILRPSHIFSFPHITLPHIFTR